MEKMRVARRPYRRMSPDNIGSFALGIRNGVFIMNPSRFPSPPMTQADFEDVIQIYQDCRTAYVNGGFNQKGPYKDAYRALMESIDDFADMTDKIPNLTSSIVTEAGFIPVKEYRSKWHVPEMGEAVVKLHHGSSSGVILAECSVVPEAERYQAILSTAPLNGKGIVDNARLIIDNLEDVVFIDVSMQRSKTFDGLNPGTIYYVYFYVGNARGVSHLSKAETIMCV